MKYLSCKARGGCAPLYNYPYEGEPLYFDVDGQPVLDMTEEMAVNQAISRVETTLVVK